MDKYLPLSPEKYFSLGQKLLLQDQTEKAEQAFLKALKITEELLKYSKDPIHTACAMEICLSLADLNMQQGNMHGADVYYVKAMVYDKK